MSRQPSLQETLSAAFESQMDNIFTSIPCIVLAIRDGLSGQMVDIQPTINKKLTNGVVKERPPILGVPVQFPVSKLSGITFPIKVGDVGLAVFSMRNLDAWKSSQGRTTTPLNRAKMDKGDAIFIPGVQPPSIAVNNPAKHVLSHDTDDLVVFHNLGLSNELEIRLKENGSLIITTSNLPVEINCSDATVNAASSINLNSPAMTVDCANTTWIGNITHTGNYTQTGTYILDSINVNLHVHSGVQSGPSNTGGMV